MNVIVRLGNKKYYYSPVFGIFKDSPSDELWDIYYIVLNETQDKLIKVNAYEVGENLDRRVLELDRNTEGLILNEEGFGCVEFLNEKDIESIINGEDIETPKLKICKNFYDEIELSDYKEVKTEEDIIDLLNLTGRFHDAYIKKINGNDDKLTVTFDGIWGCSVELVFEEEVIYKNTRSTTNVGIWWYDASLAKTESGYIILLDQDGYTKEDDIDNYSSYFMAKKLKYKVMPN